MKHQTSSRIQTKSGLSRLGGGILQRKCSCGQHTLAGDECSECSKKEKTLQRRSASGTPSSPLVPTIVHDVLRSSGQPLDKETRSFMEPRFGHDFSRVRVHTDQRAAESARAVNAQAYTVGQNVVFGTGQYALGTSKGEQLLAHELTHVVQQSTAASAPTQLSVGEVNDRYEEEAEEAARWTLHRPATGVTTPVVQRVAQPIVMRSRLFSSTVEICHRLLKSRVFKVSQSGLSVGIDARWEGPTEGAAGCTEHGKTPYEVTLTQKGYVFDQEYGSCNFDPQKLSTRAWTGLASDEYYLTIWTNNTNPNCCLVGDIEVVEDPSLKGESCTKLPDDALTILHAALDIAGLVPFLGAIPDALNAGIYSIEGDWVNAGLSAAALVPIFGEGVTVTKLGVKVTRTAVKRTGKEALVLGLKTAKETRTASKLWKIAGTRGLEHSFDRHAYEWFGRAKEVITKERYLPQWQSLLESAAESKKVFKWTLGNDAVIGHLAYFKGTIGDVTLKQGKHFAVFFFEAGHLRAGEVASAFVPDAGQLTRMLNLVK